MPPRNDGQMGGSITRRRHDLQLMKCLQRRVQDFLNRRCKVFDGTTKVSAAVYINLTASSLRGVHEVNDVAIPHTIAVCYHTAKRKYIHAKHQNFFSYLGIQFTAHNFTFKPLIWLHL